MGERLEPGSFGRAIYLGTIDDMLHKYQWGGPITEGRFRGLLLQASLFERPLLINDGYLVHYEWGRRMLRDPGSLLRALIDAKNVIILSRDPEGKIHETIVREAPRVTSYRLLLESADWGSLRDDLIRLHEAGDYKWTPWPKFDNREGFSKLATSVYDKSPVQLGLEWHLRPDDIRRCIDIFLRLQKAAPERGARTLWEEAVLSCAHSPNRRTGLMRLANEAYHFNMALSFAAATGISTGVATIFSPTFAPAYASAAPAANNVPILELSVGRPTKSLESLVAGAAREPNLRRLKEAYLVARMRASEGEVADASAAPSYSEGLNRYFSDHGSGSLRKGAGYASAGGGLITLGSLFCPSLQLVAIVGAGLSALGGVFALPMTHAFASWRVKVHEGQTPAEASVGPLARLEPITGTSWLTPKQGEAHTEGISCLPS